MLSPFSLSLSLSLSLSVTELQQVTGWGLGDEEKREGGGAAWQRGRRSEVGRGVFFLQKVKHPALTCF